MRWTRRGLLTTTGVAMLGVGAAGYGLAGRRPAAAGQGQAAPAGQRAGSDPSRVLVLVVMGGGNDGLNTVIPYGQGTYYDARPTISVPQSQVLPLSGAMGLHPSLHSLLPFYQQGQLGIVQGVGYPNPVLSHFRSMAIWQSGQPDVEGTTGWLGRYLDQTATRADDPLRAVAIGADVPLVLAGQRGGGLALASVPSFNLQGDPGDPGDMAALRTALGALYADAPADAAYGVLRADLTTAYGAVAEVQKAGQGYAPGAGVRYPASGFAQNLQLIVRLLAGGVRTQIFTVGLGGFDDHANEHASYAGLLADFSDALAAFQADLQAHGLAGRVLTVCFSEFGRRVRENASGGTDHGTAGPMFLLGGAVHGGLYGDAPNLGKLDPTGDLQYSIDFRNVFGTVVDRWLDGPAKAVFGGTYGGMDLLHV